MIPTFFLHLDWPKITEGALSAGAVAGATWLVGRRQQKWREKTDTRTADQKMIDTLVGRMDKLEGQMTTANQKIEDLRGEKMALQQQIISLQQQIALLEFKKAEFESREAIYAAHVAELEQRLTLKTEELRCVQEKLEKIEQKERSEQEEKLDQEKRNAAPD